MEDYDGQLLVIAQPASRTNAAGSTATFSVYAGGTQPLHYQWRKDGVALTDTGNIAGATSATLTLSGLLEADEGKYSVVVTNALGSVISAVAQLTVIDPAIAVHPGDETRRPPPPSLPRGWNGAFCGADDSGAQPTRLSVSLLGALGLGSSCGGGWPS